jgi:hypothetical protein
MLLLAAEFVPRLFLDRDGDYRTLSNFILLDPAWMMTAMKDVMELSIKSCEADLGRRSALVNRGIADFRLLSACWKKLVKDSVTIHHLCLICQAYCLIHPVPCEEDECDEKLPVTCEGDPPMDVNENQQYIVPCKLPPDIKDDQISKLSWVTFYFDFVDFLPDEVYHRLICLALKVCETGKLQQVRYALSKKRCFFPSIENAGWLIEKENYRVKVKVQ